MGLKVDTFCCGKSMVALGAVQALEQIFLESQQWLCPECGRCIEVTEWLLDEDEVRHNLQSHGFARTAGGQQ